jgi:muconolactone delta-isomerase
MGIVKPSQGNLKSFWEGIMKILAMEIEVGGINPEKFQTHLKAEARHVWELYQSGVIRELYFRADRSEAVLMLECTDVNEAQQILQSLPLVQASLIAFEIIPLVPYPGFVRLFGE